MARYNNILMDLLLKAWENAVRRGNPVITIYDSTPILMYMYENINASYSYKEAWACDYLGVPTKDDVEELYEAMVEASNELTKVKCCRLSKKSNGFRLRIDNDPSSISDNLQILSNLKAALANPKENKTGYYYLTPVKKETNHVTKKKGTKMNNFSLSDLKDAIVDKVTHLDRKTVMILAIIALILLIVGKYQTIKDIVLGIRDKVKNSNNFKAMVEDGTNAINSLKKIVGVKDKGAK